MNTKLQIKTYSQVAYIKINTLIDVLSWLVENINNNKLNLFPAKIKDKIEFTVLKTCGVRKER